MVNTKYKNKEKSYFCITITSEYNENVLYLYFIKEYGIYNTVLATTIANETHHSTRVHNEFSEKLLSSE